jgi:hypothetical protein
MVQYSVSGSSIKKLSYQSIDFKEAAHSVEAFFSSKTKEGC